MSIRMNDLDLESDFFSNFTAQASLGVVATGLQTNIFVAPWACEVKSIDFYPFNGFSANTSNTLKIAVFKTGASASTTSTLQVLSIATSAATNAYTANARLRLTPSANASLTNGTILQVQVSAVCQAIMSQTLCVITYKPLVHRESR